jgi:two-component system, NtrC family, nitrogen regulation sensor histidine kinase NtrY
VTRRKRLRFQNRIMAIVLLTVAPAWIATALMLTFSSVSPPVRYTILGSLSFAVLIGLVAARRHVVRPLQTLANMLEALREGDYSMRGRNVDPEDVFGEVMVEVNTLSRTLYDQRLEALEAGTLLQKIIADVDIAVFAFDMALKLRIVNRAGENLLRATSDKLQGKSAAELGLAGMLAEESGRIVAHMFPGGGGRWEIRRRSFREGGKRHELLVISELSRALREEERQAWQRIVRVIGHELNSSLTPIKSMAGTVRKLIGREPLPDDWREDARAGLAIIHDRAASLERFMGAYARLARLPPPTRRGAELAALVRRVASLQETSIAVEPGPSVHISIDPDQIEQVFINLMRNAVEAAGANGGVRVRWRGDASAVVVEVEDDGPGLARTDNLWVPFFTTKPHGTGIGLVLSREIVENHGGSISLANRVGARGCVASVRLPLG